MTNYIHTYIQTHHKHTKQIQHYIINTNVSHNAQANYTLMQTSHNNKNIQQTNAKTNNTQLQQYNNSNNYKHNNTTNAYNIQNHNNTTNVPHKNNRIANTPNNEHTNKYTHIQT